MNNVSMNFFTIQAATNSETGATSLAVDPSNAPELMPGVQPLLVSGDPGAMLAALTMQTAHDEAKVSRQQRQSAEQAQINSEAAEVQDLHDKATLQRVQGVVDGVLEIAKGACDFGAGMSDASSARETADAGADRHDAAQGAKDKSLDADKVDSLNKSADALDTKAAASKADASKWSGAGSAIGAAKSMADGFLQAAITDKDADEKMHEASADAFKRIADDAHDDEKDAHDLLNKALDFYKEYVDTKNQTAMAATHRA